MRGELRQAFNSGCLYRTGQVNAMMAELHPLLLRKSLGLEISQLLNLPAISLNIYHPQGRVSLTLSCFFLSFPLTCCVPSEADLGSNFLGLAQHSTN